MVRVSDKYGMEIILLTEEDVVDSFEVSELGEGGNYLITAVD